MTKEIKNTLAYQYTESVLSGKTLACNFIHQACERFRKDLENEDYYFDLKEVEKVNTFFQDILFVPELNKSVKLQPPHAFWLQQLFALKVRKTGFRKYNSAYLQFARKAYKTYYAAGVSLYELLFSKENNPMIMQGANSRDQAIICTAMTGRIIKASPQLKALVNDKIFLHTYKKKVNEIVYIEGKREGRVEAMPKDPGDGGNPSAGIVDEVHEANGLELYETMESGMGQREQPYILTITSPGHNKSGPCYTNLRKKSVDVLRGTLNDDTHLAIIYELDTEEEWDKVCEAVVKEEKTGKRLKKDPIDVLEKSNPMMPYSPSLRPFLRRRVIKAMNDGGEVAVNIKIKNGGVWADAPKVWIPNVIIKANNYQITDADLKDKPCYAGCDLSGGIDLNAFVGIFPDIMEKEVTLDKLTEDGKKYTETKTLPIHAVKSMFWIPTKKIFNRTDGVDYRKFVEGGWMNVFEGDTVEPDVMAQDIIKFLDTVDIRSIGADPAMLRQTIAVFLGYGGYVEPKGDFKGLLSVAPTLGMLSPATSEVEDLAFNKQFDFMGNPVMEMCFANTTLHYKDMMNDQGGISGHRMPSKGKSNGRIDGVAALVTGMRAYQDVRIEPETPQSFFEVW